jgi:hypothetical protein
MGTLLELVGIEILLPESQKRNVRRNITMEKLHTTSPKGK